jgi:hypothetical protein
MPKEGSEMPRMWKGRAWSDGPGMFRYSATPGITAEERRQLEPWNFPQEERAEYSGQK